jgi:flagellar basal body-associated protein FliL
MAEDETIGPKSNKSAKLILPISIGVCVVGVFGLFLLGYKSLTTPEPIPDDIQAIMEKAKSSHVMDEAIDEETNESKQLTSSNSTFGFAKHRYYTFPLPFISNLASGRGMITLEVAIATYGDTMDGEKIIEKLETSNPKLRSAINLKLSEQKLSDVNTVAKRKKLSKEVLEEVRLFINSLNGDSSAIQDLYLIKFVLSGVN